MKDIFLKLGAIPSSYQLLGASLTNSVCWLITTSATVDLSFIENNSEKQKVKSGR